MASTLNNIGVCLNQLKEYVYVQVAMLTEYHMRHSVTIVAWILNNLQSPYFILFSLFNSVEIENIWCLYWFLISPQEALLFFQASQEIMNRWLPRSHPRLTLVTSNLSKLSSKAKKCVLGFLSAIAKIMDNYIKYVYIYLFKFRVLQLNWNCGNLHLVTLLCS